VGGIVAGIKRSSKGPAPDIWKCTKCGELKPFTNDFYRKKGSGAWGLSKECRHCLSARDAEWKKKNPTAYAEYHAKNRDRRLAQIRKWHKENRDKELEWEAKFKDRRRCITRNYRAKKAAGGTHSAADIARIGREQRWLCVGCRQSIKDAFHVDHIVPISKGGSNNPSNLQLLCQTCNLSKGRKDAEDFMRLRGYLL
jgi:5-methylcytosine-specific restriction endonuclease McrA